MNFLVSCWEIVRSGWCAKVAILIDKNTVISCDESPNAKVEFTLLKQEWSLNVFLNDPKCVFVIFIKDEFHDVAQPVKNLDSFTLVHDSWLDDPHILFTVFEWHFFILAATL